MRVPLEFQEGLESQQCTNHFSHFLLLNLIIDIIRKAPGRARVIACKYFTKYQPYYMVYIMLLKCLVVPTNGWKEVQKYIGADFKIKLNTLHPVVQIPCRHGHHMGHQNWRICCTWDTLLYLLPKFHFFHWLPEKLIQILEILWNNLAIFLCCANYQFGYKNSCARCSNISLLQVNMT